MANLKNTIIFFGLIELISYFSAIISVFLPFMVLDAAVIKEDNYNGDVKLVIDIVREVMFDPRYQNVRYVPRSYIRFTTGVCVLIFVIISVLFAGINTFTKIIAENSKNDKSNGKTNVNIIDIIPLIFTIISIILTIISGLSIFDEYILMSIGFISLLIALIVAFVDRIAYIIVIKKHSNNVMKSFENPGQQV